MTKFRWDGDYSVTVADVTTGGVSDWLVCLNVAALSKPIAVRAAELHVHRSTIASLCDADFIPPSTNWLVGHDVSAP
jgi:hypothetical protein